MLEGKRISREYSSNGILTENKDGGILKNHAKCWHDSPQHVGF